MMGMCINLSVLCLGKIGGESSKTDDDANGVNEIETSNDSWCDCKQFLVTKMLRKGRLGSLKLDIRVNLKIEGDVVFD